MGAGQDESRSYAQFIQMFIIKTEVVGNLVPNHTLDLSLNLCITPASLFDCSFKDAYLVR